MSKEKKRMSGKLPKTVVLKFPESTRIFNIDIRIWLWVIIGLFLFVCIKVLFFSEQHYEAISPTVFLNPDALMLAKDGEYLTEENLVRMMSRRVEKSQSLIPPVTYNNWTQSANAALKLSSFVLDQGPIGSCTANALSYAWMLYKYKTWRNTQLNVAPPSRMYWYAEARLHMNANEGIPNAPLKDTGCYVKDIAWVPVGKGLVSELSYPYTYNMDRFGKVSHTQGNINKVPSDAIELQAAENKLAAGIIKPFNYSSNRETTLLNMKLAISTSGKCIILGILVFSSFMTRAVLQTGNIPMPNPSREKIIGGHCICLTGYDTTCFTFRNSWGKNYGAQGTFRIPYDYITSVNLSGDAWIF
jgi:C1A family cysteine protease